MNLALILVKPEDPRNVGAALRAAANFGVHDVVIVGHEKYADWEREVRIASSGAWVVTGGLKYASDLAEAVAGSEIVVGTSARKREGFDDPMTPREFFNKVRPDGRIAIVLGAESQGLAKSEMDLCHQLIRIPSDPQFSSLNLAQAAVVILYEASARAAERGLDGERPGAGGVVTVAHLERGRAKKLVAPVELQERLLLQIAERSTPAVVAQLRRLLSRAEPRSEDIPMLFNLLRDCSGK